MTATDGTLLLRAILADPADDTARLVYADWLDEHGEPDRAEFIRSQVGVARFDWRNCGGYYCQTYHTGNTMHVDCRGERMRLRQMELWPRVVQELDDLPRCGGTWVTTADWIPQADPPGWGVGTVLRGFVSDVRCPLPLFTAAAARALFTTHPVVTVRLNDREPMESGDGADGIGGPDWVWVIRPSDDALYPVDERRHFLPRALWERLAGYITTPSARVRARRYPNPAAARAALCDACVAWGRELAGLPDLPHSEPSA